MDTGTRPTSSLHPLAAVAAVSVIGFSATGIGVMTGAIPSTFGSHPKAEATVPQTVLELMPAAAPSVPAYTAATRLASAPVAPKKKPAAKPAEPVRVASSEPAPLPAPVPAPAAAAPPPPAVAAEAPKCLDCGIVESVREVEQKGESSWMGPVAGGIGGAILGKQMGKGAGNTIMTVLGAAGGAYAGHEIEKRVRSTRQWVVNVRMNDGSSRTLSYPSQPQWHAGEKVRVENGTLLPDQKA